MERRCSCFLWELGTAIVAGAMTVGVDMTHRCDFASWRKRIEVGKKVEYHLETGRQGKVEWWRVCSVGIGKDDRERYR